MLPKEHGAYGQMALPLATAMLACGVTTPGLLLATAIIAGFLAHEPLLVLLGHRGTRASRESEGRATRWLAATTVTAAVAGAAGAWWMPAGTRWSLALPVLPASLLAAAIAGRREKGAVAEVAAATAFSLAAVPVSLAAGAPVRAGIAIAAVFAGVFVTATVAVRGIIETTRGGGDPAASRKTRRLALSLAGGTAVALAASAMLALLPWTAALAAAPGLGTSAGLALSPPRPTRLRAVGWTLVATSVAAAVVLAIGLETAP